MIKIRIRIISFLIHTNELIFFYPKLARAYRKLFSQKKLNFAIDVGVNKGQTIFFLKKINKNTRIIGFEPHKALYSKLTERIKDSKIKIFNLGCSDQEGEAIFKENILSESSSFETVNENSRWLKKKETILGLKNEKLVINEYNIKTIRLNNFIQKEFNDLIIDMIKIDVEGHELKVLNGLFPIYSNNVIRYIQIESNEDDLYKDNSKAIKKLLNEKGFYHETSIKHGFGNFYDIIYKNKYFE